MDLVAILALLVWIAVGVPYGYGLYSASVAAGTATSSAIMNAVLWGAIWPLEQLVKAIISTWQNLFTPKS